MMSRISGQIDPPLPIVTHDVSKKKALVLPSQNHLLRARYRHVVIYGQSLFCPCIMVS